MSIISAGGAVTGADAGPTIDPRDYFFTKTYTGNGSTLAVTGVGFQPDFVWIKTRSSGVGSTNHFLFDAVRGATKHLFSNSTAAEAIDATELTSFDVDGFSLGSDISVNGSGESIVAWNWKANGAGSSNTDGTITSTVSANTDSGFSIVTYTGNGVSGASVGHGLGLTPSLIFTKMRSGTTNWVVYTTVIDGSLDFLRLNLDTAKGNSLLASAPNSTVFLVGGADNNVNGETVVAYCFAEISGFSKIGSYTGNGSATGPSVTTDFEPSFLMIKRTDSTGDWIIHDSARDATNPRTAFLEPNTSDAEGSGLDVDFNSTSFQIKSSSATVNANGGTYIYMCIA